MINGRAKGLSYEREIANKLKEVYPDAQRHLEDRIDQCHGYDLDNTGNFRIQCKRGRKYAPINKIEEVQLQEGEIPLLITKGDRKEDIVCMYFGDFMDMLKDFNG